MTRYCVAASLLLSMVLHHAATGASRIVEAEKTAERMTLDGAFSETSWGTAAWQSGFFELRRTGVKVNAQTRVAVLCGDRALYIGVIAEDPSASSLVAKVTEDDRRVFDDDSIEIFLNPHAYQDERYFWLCFNSIGTRSDGKGIQAGAAMDLSWSAPWKVATAVSGDRWAAEVEIPFYILEIDDRVDGTWRFNVGRNHRSGGKTIHSTLNPLEGGFQNAPGFGFLAGLDRSSLSAFAWDVGRPAFAFAPKGERMRVEVNVPVKNKSGAARELVAEGYLISPEERIAVDEFAFHLDVSGEKEVHLANYLVSEAGDYEFMFNLRDRRNMKTVHLSTSECQVSFVPMVVEIVKPAYRDTIYATAPLDEVEVRIRLREEPTALRDRRLNVVLQARNGALMGEEKLSDIEKDAVSVTFPAQGLAEGQYDIVVTLSNKVGEQIARIEKTITKRGRSEGDEVVCDPVTGRVILVNGKPFMPIGWGALNPTQMQAAAAAGYNCIFHYYPSAPPESDAGEYVKLRLDTAVRYGLKTTQYAHPSYAFLRHLGRVRASGLNEEQKQRITEGVEAYKDHQGLFAWYLSDEPECHEESPVMLKALKGLVSELDPYHPTLIVNNSPQGHHTYKDGADIYAPDVYSFHKKDRFDYDFTRERVVASLDAAYEATQGRKPIWIIFEAFNSAATGTNFEDMRGLTFEEYRVLVHLAITHRANGFFLYKADSPYTEYPELKIGWEQCLVPTLQYLSQVILFGTEKPLKVSSDTGKVHALLKEHKGELYLVAANAAATPAQATFQTADGLEGKTLKLVGEAGEIKCDRNGFDHMFDAYEAHVYTTLQTPAPLTDLEAVRATIREAVAALRKAGNLAYADPLRKSAVVTAASSTNNQLDCHLVTDGMTGGLSYWQDRTRNEFPDWVEVKLAERQQINKVIVYTPNLKDYDLQYEDGDDWKTLDKVVGNTKTTITHRFEPVAAERIRLLIHAVNPPPPYTVDGLTLDYVTQSLGGFSKVHEVEVYCE